MKERSILKKLIAPKVEKKFANAVSVSPLMPMFAASPVAPERRIEKTQQGSAANPSKAKAKVAPAAQVQKSSKSPVKKAAPPVVQLNAKKNKAIQQK